MLGSVQGRILKGCEAGRRVERVSELGDGEHSADLVAKAGIEVRRSV